MAVRALLGDVGAGGRARRSAVRPDRHTRAVRLLIAALGGLAVVAGVLLADERLPWLAWDSRTYWEAARSFDPYANARVGELGAYLYSPAFLQALRPAVLLPWPGFLFVWAAATVGVAWILIGGRGLSPTWLATLAGLALLDVWAGNVNVFLAGAVAVGLRWPVVWSFLVLTKVSPGLGLLWFVARGEWRSLALAVGATLGIAAASALADPEAWLRWFEVLLSNQGASQLNGDVPIPAVVRFPIGAALTWWGARTDRRWVMPITTVLFLPVIWPNGLSILIGCAALRGPSRERVPGTAPVAPEPARQAA